MAALRMTQQEAERIIREHQAVAGKPCFGATIFRSPKPDSDDSDGGLGDDDGGGAGQPVIAYEVT